MFKTNDFSFVHKYFMAEKQGSLLLLGIGVVAIVFAIVFILFIKANPSFYKGLAIPLIAIGLLQSIVGYNVYSRSDKQRIDVAYKIGIDTGGFIRGEELPRMQRINKNFTLLKYIEIALLIVGLVLIFIYRNNIDKSFLYGIGLALAIQAAVSLFFDYNAEKRALEYTKQITGLLKN